MNVEIISVGTELLLGQTTNTNARFLSQQLADLGLNVYYQTTVGDNRNRLLKAFELAAERADMIITTGGLGPTDDDLTKEALAEYLGMELKIVPEELDRMKKIFHMRKLEWVESNSKQAAFLPGSTVLFNKYGTAPGLAIKVKNKAFILLPGPPREMEPMFLNHASLWIEKNMGNTGVFKLYSRMLKFLGISESKLEAELHDLIAHQTEPTLATLASMGEVHLRLSARAKDKEAFQELITPVLTEIKGRVGEFIVAEDGETIAGNIGRLLKAHGLRVATAESCTGGMLSAALTAVPGSSSYYTGSVVAYSNEVKTRVLGVSAEIIAEYGAVSEQTALAMAQCVRRLTGSDIGIGITGVAGPDGGTKEKPVGFVCIALSAPDKDVSCTNQFKGDREFNRLRSIKAAQYLLFNYLSKIKHE